MKKKRAAPRQTAALRRRAEACLEKNDKVKAVRPATRAEMQRLLHELEVHKIELEMQNEELLRARAETEALLRQYTDLYDFARVGYFSLDRDGAIRQANLVGARLLGVARARLARRRFSPFVDVESRPVFNAFLENVFESRAKETCELKLLKAGSEPLYLDMTARVSENGRECRAVAADITTRKRAELELRYASTHDALTGSYNRGFFEEELARFERGRQFPVSIMMADVNNLKGTNDNEGHAAGDEILKRVVNALNAAFRDEDIIARLGGDEFAVLLPHTGVAAARDALRRLQNVLQAQNAVHPGRPVCLSIGASTAEQHASLADVLKKADENMYREKHGLNVS